MTARNDGSTVGVLPTATEPPARWQIAADLGYLREQGLVGEVVVTVRGEIIESVAVGATPDDDAIRVPGATLLPGLIDPHQHLEFSGEPGMIDELQRDPSELLALRSAGNAQRALSSGITTVVDCGGHAETILNLRAASQRGLQALPRIVSCGAPITTTAGHCHWLGGTADSVEDVIKRAREQIALGADFIKVMLSGGNLTKGSNPSALQYAPEILEALAQECRRLRRPLVVHVHSAHGFEIAAAAGATVLAHGTCMHPDGSVGASPELIQAAVDNGVAVDPTLLVGHARDGGALTPRGELRRQMLPSFRAMADAGVALFAGTDAGVPGIAHDDLPDAIESLVSDVGLPVETALAGASHLVADAFGLSECGSIEPGNLADLVLVPGDVANDRSILRRPLAVWKGGRLMTTSGPPVSGSGS